MSSRRYMLIDSPSSDRQGPDLVSAWRKRLQGPPWEHCAGDRVVHSDLTIVGLIVQVSGAELLSEDLQIKNVIAKGERPVHDEQPAV